MSSSTHESSEASRERTFQGFIADWEVDEKGRVRKRLLSCLRAGIPSLCFDLFDFEHGHDGGR